MLEKKLQKAKTINKYFIDKSNDKDNTLTSELNFRQSLIESQEFMYSITSSTAVVKSTKISDFLVFESNKNNDFNA
jgi:hypothetical protein